MQSTGYQGLKLQIMDVVSLSKDAIHMHIGMGVFLVAVLVRRSSSAVPDRASI